jgi:uncharacterized protein YyaL (SSP411 family)
MPRDGKLLAGMNGLALTALSEAAGSRPEYLVPAQKVYRFLTRRVATDAGLRKGLANATSLGPAELEDYAYVIEGLNEYGQASGRREAQDWARRLARAAWRDFHREGLWLREVRPLLAGQSGEIMLSDGALPSPSATLIRFSRRSGDPVLNKRAQESLSRALEIVERDPLGYPGSVTALAGY